MVADGRRSLGGGNAPADAVPPAQASDPQGQLLDLARAAAGIGTFDWDLATGALTWDDRLLELFGLDEATFVRTIEGFKARLHPDDVDRVTGLLQQAIDTCGDYEAQYRIQHDDGSLRWIAARGRALCDVSGAPERVLGAAWDVTAVHTEAARSVRILETMSVGFYAIDADWRFTYVNGPAEKLLGVTRHQAVGQVVWDLFPAARDSAIGRTYRETLTTGQPATFDAHYPAPLNAWYEIRVWPEENGLAVFFLDITERKSLQQRSELLAEVTRELTGTLDAEEAVARLADLVVPALADWCMVTLVADDQQSKIRRSLRDVGFAHADPRQGALVAEYADVRIPALLDGSFLERAMATGRPVVVQDGAARRISDLFPAGRARDIIEQLDPETLAVLPLRGRGRTAGLLSLFRSAGRGGIPAHDVDTAADIAARAGLALDNARLYREQRGLAEGLQRSLLTPPPEPDHVQIVVRYVPASQAAQVGGDWYDAFLQPNGATMLVIGDVVGHDTQAAAAMGQIRTIVRTLGAEADHGPADVLSRADAVMATLMVATVATVAVARLEQTPDEESRGVTRVRWSNAGHPPPFVINPDGSVQPLIGLKPELLLGVRPDTERREFEAVLDRGSVVVLYTDGLVERRDQDLDTGLLRLQDALEELAGRGLDELCDELLARMLPGNADDDVALVAVQLHPQNVLRPAAAGPNVVPPNVPDSRAIVPEQE
ncbi:SpoIIE family protein phosphatase [uncultured Modestobacter sp.]|uniref:SpoIIE family protein phosphatase n=1 Tax=uncultured Modestobacter sp. TaxID=380048 RepID=UPI00262F2900|nr:SpoIIE family protein phosphatase [uncultured Modestobacter sp.]